MSELAMDLSWKLSSAELRPGAYFSAHSIIHNNDSCKLAADAAPDYGSYADYVNPEKLTVQQQRAHRYCFIVNSLADSLETNISEDST